MALPARVPGHEEAPRANMLMHSGRWVHLFDPSPADIMLNDWVRGASRVCRWGGQTKGEIGFNDLCHHLLVDDILVRFVWPDAPYVVRQWAMCHDLHEGGGLGDICTPYGRWFAQAGLKELKGRLDAALRLSMGMTATVPDNVVDAIKKADTIAAVSEAVQLMDWPEKLARRDIGGSYRGRLWRSPIQVLDEQAAREAWWLRFRLVGGPSSPR